MSTRITYEVEITGDDRYLVSASDVQKAMIRLLGEKDPEIDHYGPALLGITVEVNARYG